MMTMSRLLAYGIGYRDDHTHLIRVQQYCVVGTEHSQWTLPAEAHGLPALERRSRGRGAASRWATPTRRTRTILALVQAVSGRTQWEPGAVQHVLPEHRRWPRCSADARRTCGRRIRSGESTDPAIAQAWSLTGRDQGQWLRGTAPLCLLEATATPKWVLEKSTLRSNYARRGPRSDDIVVVDLFTCRDGREPHGCDARPAPRCAADTGTPGDNLPGASANLGGER